MPFSRTPLYICPLQNSMAAPRYEPPMPMTTSTSLSLWIFFAAFWIRENSSLS